MGERKNSKEYGDKVIEGVLYTNNRYEVVRAFIES